MRPAPFFSVAGAKAVCGMHDAHSNPHRTRFLPDDDLQDQITPPRDEGIDSRQRGMRLPTRDPLVEKGADADCLREMIQYVAQRLMELDVETLCGAAHGERSAERANSRAPKSGGRFRRPPVRTRTWGCRLVPTHARW